MVHYRKVFNVVILSIFLISFFQPFSQTSTVSASQQSFKESLSKDVEQYIKKSGGDIAIEYRDLSTGELFQRKSMKAHMAASTIKLPLATYVMELADKKKINLKQKLTYKSYHYVGGSGVIQYQKVGTKFTIIDLVKKAMIYSDNIAFNMLKERVGENNYANFMKSLGASYSTPNALRNTSAHDLSIYVQHLYKYSQGSKNGKLLINYLQHTIYNDAIPKGIKGVKISHKVGMIPMYKVSHDYGIIYDQDPFVLVVMTKGFTYERSNKVIAGIASIVNKHHKNKLKYIQTKSEIPVYKSQNKKAIIGVLNKEEVFRVSLINEKWLGIQYGKAKGYIQNLNVSRYSKSPNKLNNKIIEMNRKVRAKNKTLLLKSTSLQAQSFASINKGVQFTVAKVNKDYYAILLGNRIGYTKASDVTLEN